MTRAAHQSRSGLNLLVRLAIGLGSIGLSLALLGYMVRTRPAPPEIEHATVGKIVQTVIARQRPIAQTWTAYGTARPLRESDVASEVAATVIERPESIEPGNSIDQGDLIVALDDRQYIAQADRSRQSIAALQAQIDGLDVNKRTLAANVELARENIELLNQELELLQEAAKASGASPVEIDRLRRQITVARRDERRLVQELDLVPIERARLTAQIGVERSNLELAELDVQRTRILAPIRGVIQSVSVRKGERLAPGMPVARITDLSRMEIPLAVPMSAAGSLGIGTTVELSPTSQSGRAWTGRVMRVSPEADPASRTFSAFVVVEQDSTPNRTTLLPGQFVSGRVRAGHEKGMVLAPRVAVIDDRVKVVSAEGRVESRAVEVAFYVDEFHPEISPGERQWAVIAAGIDDGMQIIISNLDELREGDPVTTQFHKKPDEPATASRSQDLPVGGNGVASEADVDGREPPR